MNHSERTRRADAQAHPGQEATVAGALAPPPRSTRTLQLFLAAFLLALCGVAGVLMLFTAVPVGYAAVLLTSAFLAAVHLRVLLRRNAGGEGG